MKEITIQEMRAKKIQTEAYIAKAISDFQNDTGAIVHDIRISDTLHERGVRMPTHFIELEVRL
jgi:DNA-binding cell septation regulator SpoVG